MYLRSSQPPLRPELGVIILAAGSSTRLGRPKSQVRLHGKTLLQHALQNAQALNPRWLGVVMARSVRQPLHRYKNLHILIHPNPMLGMGSSIALGVKLAPKALKALLVMTVDQWAISEKDLRRLVHGGLACRVARYGHRKDIDYGIPVVFPRQWFTELRQLTGDRGAKRLLAEALGHRQPGFATSAQRYRPMVQVPIPHAAFDIDTPEQLAALKRYSRCTVD